MPSFPQLPQNFLESIPTLRINLHCNRNNRTSCNLKKVDLVKRYTLPNGTVFQKLWTCCKESPIFYCNLRLHSPLVIEECWKLQSSWAPTSNTFKSLDEQQIRSHLESIKSLCGSNYCRFENNFNKLILFFLNGEEFILTKLPWDALWLSHYRHNCARSRGPLDDNNFLVM